MSLEQIQVRLNPDVQPSGSDLAVVNAARRSFNTRSDWLTSGSVNDYPGVAYQNIAGRAVNLSKKDDNLIKYLARGMRTKDWKDFIDRLEFEAHWAQQMDNDYTILKEMLWQFRNTPTHDTPFNHCHISFEVKAPIFVARQLVKTEYAPFSEFSRRYITDDIEFYIHDYRMVAEDVKQGSGGIHPDNEQWQVEANEHNLDSIKLYNLMIKEGVAPEQARGVLPVDLMTSWTWSATLGAFAKMCRERLGSDAQKETAYVAQQVYEYLKTYYPVSAKALVEGC